MGLIPYLGTQTDSSPRRIALYLEQVSRTTYALESASETQIYRRRQCSNLYLSDWPDGKLQQKEFYVLEDEHFDHIQLIDGMGLVWPLNLAGLSDKTE